MGQHRIVVIDDNDSDVTLLRVCLERIGTNHELIVLKDGNAALQFIEAERQSVEPRPCVIIIDLYLPKYNGLQILEAIRRTPALEHVTVLIASTNLSPDTRQQIKELGVAYAEKPYTLPQFEAFARLVWELCESTDDVAA